LLGASTASQVIAQNRDPTVEALGFKTLANDDGGDLGVDLQEPLDLIFEGIELT
jgi:hypothetical protein